MTTTEQLNDLRRRVLAGEEVTREELTSAFRALRAEREAAMQRKTTAASKSVAKQTVALPEDLNDLFK